MNSLEVQNVRVWGGREGCLEKEETALLLDADNWLDIKWCNFPQLPEVFRKLWGIKLTLLEILPWKYFINTGTSNLQNDHSTSFAWDKIC